MSKRFQWLSITLGCIAAFIILRSLPVESCEFLHYGDYVSADGVIEGCGYEETSFFDLDALRYPILFELVPDEMPVAGQPVTFSVVLRTTTGRAIDASDIAITHTERLHALVVDESLQDYQHIHPEPAGPKGHFRFEITPGRAGTYQVYLDFIPLINNRRTLLAASFNVAGEPPAGPDPVEKRLTATAHTAAGAHQFELSLDVNALRTGEPMALELKRTGGTVEAPDFELVMGAYAHLVAFEADRIGFAHLHPINTITAGQDPKRPDMRFQLELDKPGHYRVWAQVRIDGEDVFLPFDLPLRS